MIYPKALVVFDNTGHTERHIKKITPAAQSNTNTSTIHFEPFLNEKEDGFMMNCDKG